MNKLMISSLLVFVVFLAGCAQQTTTSGGTGVIIKSFAPDLTTVDAGSTVTFSLAVKNTGEKSATDVKALVFGLSDEWIFVPVITATQSIATSLGPADPATGMTGDEAGLTWDATIDATKGKKMVDVTYDASVRVFYKYTTISDTILKFVTNDYAKTNPTAPKGVISSKGTAGPLLITATARTPMLATGTTTGRVQFEIQNIGGGRVFKTVTSAGVVGSADLDKIEKIEITGIGTAGLCSGGTGAGTSTFTDTKMAGGKSKIISCDIDVGSIVNFADRAPKITVTYSYFVDSASQVTVSKALQ